ncbi:F0F1 ATP synthase subunit A [Pelagicoccus sp. SDUM812002]|uniref:F0F1 ATP synthase subunit A n=1 Tax=Pelagicoccus sp. SDUM812002 TaxID=3041266 RepID=UPI00280D8408|nr:F0F1 ATP synthase subunit A [Pelagicoccus sp. SDUM812002]MDQ8184716.1 F0F1 ATP synthase subunit A [Pelagicoccus sp. SDUM812002]
MAGKKTFLLSSLALLLPVADASAAVSPAANELFNIFGLPVTNSMVTSWVISILLIVGIRAMVGRPKMVPSKGQALVESMLCFVRDTTKPIVGSKAFRLTLPMILGLFFYILIQNWSGLLPGVGSVGMGYTGEDGHFHVTEPWIRPANADWNGTIALAGVTMIAWLFIVLKSDGPVVLIRDLFGNKADKKEVGKFMWMALWPIFLIVGVIEVVSILIRPLTLSVRLFGNIYGGESLLHQTGFIFPFYFLELIVGFVQPLVFILLFSVYVGLICNHGDGEEHH